MQPSSEPVYVMEGLTKRYTDTSGGEVEALSQVNLEVYDREFLALVGPSGCGKSTLLRILCGVLPRTEGRLLLRGRPVQGPQRDFGVVFQKPVLFPWLTVLDNVLMALKITGKTEPAMVRRAEELLDMVGLRDFKRRYPFELSGGMQQRASIARALVHDPAVLLMDEPFAALDALTREFMASELLHIHWRSQKTIVFITHSIAEAVMLADRVAVMSARPGRIKEVLAVDFPRPRDLSVTTDPRFGRLTATIRDLLDPSLQ